MIVTHIESGFFTDKLVLTYQEKDPVKGKRLFSKLNCVKVTRYNKWIGRILKLFNFAINVEINGTDFYINKKSALNKCTICLSQRDLYEQGIIDFVSKHLQKVENLEVVNARLGNEDYFNDKRNEWRKEPHNQVKVGGGTYYLQGTNHTQ